MYRHLVMSTQRPGPRHAAADYLRQEIAFLEMRLLEMGDRGDCAYEHALSKAYQVLLQERRQQLARL
jgi:hypothetical protein